MDRRSLLALISALILLFGAGRAWLRRPVSHGPGVVAPETPVQARLKGADPIQMGEYGLTPMAEFEVEARVLSLKWYRWGRESDLAPVDLALGWGAMSDEEVLDHFSIHQSGRFYFWSTRTMPIPRGEVEGSSGNMHIIPADSTVKRILKKIRKGHVVRLTGNLVNIEAPDGWHWNTSLSRKDTGGGSCELFWVEQAAITAP